MGLKALIVVVGIIASTAFARHVKHETSVSLARSAPPSTSTVTGQTAGPTPFIVNLQVSINQAALLKSIQFVISPKPGSVTHAISATYYTDYLLGRGFLNIGTGQATVPVFGLYQNYANTVTLTYCFNDGSSQQDVATVSTTAFSDPCGYHTPTVVQARTSSTSLSYDFFMVKSNCGIYSPTILDTDGEIRWVGTAGFGNFVSTFYQEGVYIANVSTLVRIELDGTFAVIGSYNGILKDFHHNIDYGKQGIILEADTTSQTESFVVAMDGSGNVLKTWDLAAIISAAMTAGGDDPTQFVQPAPTDWFHNNAVTYRSSDNSLIVSSRENFVICLDYDTGAIKWILGDPTKKWYQFPSLQQYALALGPSTLPPIGQHAVSITQDDDLLLFDDGNASLHQIPPGASRTYSAPRKYHIDSQAKTATEVWNYEAGQTLYSAICSSVYEDSPLNYLIDYATIGRIMGLDAAGNKIFDYQYVVSGCNVTWNSIPVHLDGLMFMGTVPMNPTAGWRITSIGRNGSDVVVSFPAVAGKTYRLEYKTSLAATTWTAVADLTAASTCSPAEIHDPTGGGSPPRFYRVRQVPP